jgi:hypothetical protein
MITSSSNVLKNRCHHGNFISPIKPTTRSSPDAKRTTSDAWSHKTVADWESDRSVPMSPWDLVGGLGFILQGLTLVLIAYKHTRKGR